MFAAAFGLHPWDVNRLTLTEFDVYAAAIDSRAADAAE